MEMLELLAKGFTQAEVEEIQQARKRHEAMIEMQEEANAAAIRGFGKFGIIRRRPCHRKPQARPVNSPGVPRALRRAS